MSTHAQEAAAPALAHRERKRAAARMLFATTALLGALLLMYPLWGQWFARWQQGDAVIDYSQAQAGAAAADQKAELAAADEYNRAIPAGQLTDPFTATTDSGTPLDDAGQRRYEGLLNTQGDGIMGTITIPKLDVALPIYHGATAAVLNRGAGHVYGSSLPVGGPGTHAVIAGHSGIPGSRFFNDLAKMAPGDVFKISVSGRELYYRVTGSQVVLPTDVSSLRIEPGRDQVTLLSCVPIGINSHRLLVHAERTDPPPDAWSDADAARAPFPWWVLPVAGAVAAWILLLARAGRRSGRRRS